MRFGSVCSGIEAASVAWHPLGWKAAWLSEIEPFPCAVLKYHYADVPNLGDMTKLPGLIASGEVEAPDVFCGGTPCQAFSVAGLRKSLDDARGNLSLVFCEIANAIDIRRAAGGAAPAIIFWENVPGVLSTKDNAFGCFLAGLAGEDDPLVPPGEKWTNAGCVYGPTRTVAWRVLDAQYFGVAQRRRRVFVVASARDDFDPVQVLLEFDGVRRDTAPSREAGEGAAGGFARSVALRGREGGGTAELGDDLQNCLRASSGGGDKPHVITMAHGQGGAEISIDRGPTLTCNHEAPIAAYPATVRTLRGEGFDASEDGTGRGTPLVPVTFRADAMREGTAKTPSADAGGRVRLRDPGMGMYEDIAPTLDCGAAHGVAQPVGVTIHGTAPTVQKVASYDEVAQCLRARPPGNIDNSSTTVVQQPVAFTQNSRSEVRLIGGDGGVVGALAAEADAQQQNYVASPVAFHPTQDPISSTDGTTHAMGCGSSGATATVAVAFDPVRYGDHQQDTLHHEDGIMSTLPGGTNNNAGHYTTTIQAMQVRRLTPVECERLQGFSDSYTQIPWRGKPADRCPDGPRYKALGNSWAIPCVAWIGKRIQEHINGSR